MDITSRFPRSSNLRRHLQQGLGAMFRVLGTQVRRRLRRRLPIVPETPNFLSPTHSMTIPCHLARVLSFLPGGLGMNLPWRAVNLIHNVMGLLMSTLLVYLTKNVKLHRKMSPTHLCPARILDNYRNYHIVGSNGVCLCVLQLP